MVSTYLAFVTLQYNPLPRRENSSELYPSHLASDELNALATHVALDIFFN
jgi:hypothetical protein